MNCFHVGPGIHVCRATAVATPGYLFDEWNPSYMPDRAQRELSNLPTERCQECTGLGHDGQRVCGECFGWGRLIAGRPRLADLELEVYGDG